MSNKQNDIWEENKRELKCMYCGGEGAMCQKCKKKKLIFDDQFDEGIGGEHNYET